MNKYTALYGALAALSLAFGVSFTANAGDVSPPVFGDFVWNDINGDGFQDIDEPGIADVLIRVCNSPSALTIDCSDPFSSSTLTDSLGYYSVPLSWSTPSIAVFVDLATVPAYNFATTPTELFFDNSFCAFCGQFTQDADFGFQLTPVPLPAAVWLFGSGLVALIGVVRRNRRT